MTTINDISDLARIIREQPEWADTLRTLLLGRELLELPSRFAEFVELTTRNFQLVNERLERLESDMAVVKEDVSGLKTDVSGLKTDMAVVKEDVSGLKTDMTEVKGRLNTIEGRLNRIDGRVDNALGSNYELKVRDNTGAIIGQLIRRIKVLKGRASDSSEFEELLDDAQEKGVITGEQSRQIQWIDLVLSGRRRADDAEVYLAAEISITIGDSDILRAAERAAILSACVDRPVISAVIGEHIDDARTELAAANGVVVLLTPAE